MVEFYADAADRSRASQRDAQPLPVRWRQQKIHRPAVRQRPAPSRSAASKRAKVSQGTLFALHAFLATIFCNSIDPQGLCSFARNWFGEKPCRPLLVCSQVIWRKRWPRSAGTGQRWQRHASTKQDGMMPYLLKPSRSPAGPSHGFFIARATFVAKRRIEQFLSNRSGAGRWPGRCSGYGWLLFVIPAHAGANKINRIKPSRFARCSLIAQSYRIK